jgi:DNA polymerase III sliding clamp (beta) subunit (PCNA family)
MKFVIQKQALVSAVGKMHEVASKGIKDDFQLSNRLKIEASDKSVTIEAANGYLFGEYIVSDNVTVTERGSVMVWMGHMQSLFSREQRWLTSCQVRWNLRSCAD